LCMVVFICICFFFQAEDGIRDRNVTGVQTCALPIVFGTDMNGKDYRRWDANGATALIIGNEGKGISPLLKKSVDETLAIPMIGHVQSLNASVAASLLIYQGYNSRHPLA